MLGRPGGREYNIEIFCLTGVGYRDARVIVVPGGLVADRDEH